MLKSVGVPLLLMSVGLVSAPASAAMLGPQPEACASGSGTSAILVRVTGFKNRIGKVRVRSYANPSTFFDKRAYLLRLEEPVPNQGRVEFCVPVPSPGVYAIDIRHDANNNGKSDTADGGGASGNPKVSFFDLILKRKPSPKHVAVSVGQGVTPITIVLSYLQGGSLKPLASGG